MKKAAALLLAGVMALSLAACGGGGDSGGSTDNGSTDNGGETQELVTVNVAYMPNYAAVNGGQDGVF